MSDEQKALRGSKAKELLENSVLQETLSSLEDHYIEAWRNSKTLEAREDAFRYVQLTKRFITDLQAISKDGQFSAHRTRELEGRTRSWPKF